jgi:hypothetical protein
MDIARKYQQWPLLLSLPLGLLAAAALRYAFLIPGVYAGLLTQYPALKVPFMMEGVEEGVLQFSRACLACSGLFLSGSILGILVRRPWVLRLVRLGYVAWGALFLWCVAVINLCTRLVLDNKIMIDGVTPDPGVVFFWRWHLLWPAGVVFLFVAVLYILSLRRQVMETYGYELDDGPAFGDRVVENVRTHGREPAYRKSMWLSVVVHLLIIIVIPWLLSLRGCTEDYRIQKGSGTPSVAAVPVVKIVKAKKAKKKKYMLNAKSAISFHVPDLDEKMSQATYAADASRVLSKGGIGGKTGAGGGKTGGWPDGMEGAVVRFIRLEYSGSAWDDGMDVASRSDMNFLEEFKRQTGLKVADKSESHPISQLASYRKGFAPPFVFMCGAGGISIPPRDIKVLREYLMGGGMLFADCGSPEWDRQFRTFIQVLFPGQALLEIADDDPIFQAPFAFANGAPPLWHHGGNRALGVRVKDRWAVFYHPGDIHDAWKSGHSGLTAELASGSMEMGVNIVYYSFTRYLEATRKHSK